MIIDDALLDHLLKEAAKSERHRTSYDLRTSRDDNSQRMLNVLLPGTKVPIHRHRDTAETMIVLRGRLSEVFYDDEGKATAHYDLCPAEGRFGLQVPKGQWHTVIVNEACIIFESKDGAYQTVTPDDVMEHK